MRIAFGLVAAGLVLAAAGHAQAGPLEEANKKLVVDFQRRVLIAQDADAAVQFIGDTYIQHNPRVPDGRDALQRFVAGMRQNAPGATAELKRVIAEGDLVMLHSHVKRSPEDRGSSLVDIFRVENGKIVEHWDTMQAVPETSANANTMF